MNLPVIEWKLVGNINTASSRLRGIIPNNIFNQKGWNSKIWTKGTISKADISIFQKCYTKQDIAIAKELKSHGQKLIFDLCDNHFYNPLNTNELTERTDRLSEIISLSDVITVSTTQLGKMINHPKIHIIDDAVEYENLNYLKKLYFKYTHMLKYPTTTSLVWFGNSGSENPRFGMVDLIPIIPILNSIANLHKIQLIVISDSEEAFIKYLKPANFKKTFYKWDQKNFSYLLSKCDICLIPINQNPFTLCKTNNRVIKSLLQEVPVIADPIPAYMEFSDFIYFSNWRENIQYIIENRSSVKQKVELGVNYIQQKYTSELVFSQWKGAMDDCYR